MCLGVPGKVVEIGGEQRGLPMGRVEFGGVLREVCLAYVPDIAVGDYVLVHVGFAISKMNESEAQELFGYLEEIDALGRAASHEARGEGEGTEAASPRASSATTDPEQP